MSRDWTADDIARQTDAAKSLLAELAADGLTDDEELTHDMIEGETSFFEAVDKALSEIDECDIMIEGLAAKIKQLTSRKKRNEDRAKKLRGLIDQAFQMAQLKRHKFERATITTKNVPPSLIVTDEADIPSKYFDDQPPKLNKKRLFDDVKSGISIPGASQTNGGTTIQIRKD